MSHRWFTLTCFYLSIHICKCVIPYLEYVLIAIYSKYMHQIRLYVEDNVLVINSGLSIAEGVDP